MRVCEQTREGKRMAIRLPTVFPKKYTTIPHLVDKAVYKYANRLRISS